MRVTPDPSIIADVYIDESSQNNHRYLVIGCAITMMTDAPALGAAIMKARLPELPQDEAKWTKVSKKKLPVRNPVQRGRPFQRKADSNPVIADSR